MPGEINAVDDFFSESLGTDLALLPPGQTSIVESPAGENSALRLLVSQSRCVIATHGRLLKTVSGLARALGIEQLRHPETIGRLAAAVSRTLGARKSLSASSGPVFYCARSGLRPAEPRPVRPVQPHELPALRASGLYDDALAEGVERGTCFAAWEKERVVAVCGTLPVPHHADRVADIWFPGTLERFRGQGFGRAVLYHTTRAVFERNLVPIYQTSDRNLASQHAARAAGYREYGWQLRLLPGGPTDA